MLLQRMVKSMAKRHAHHSVGKRFTILLQKCIKFIKFNLILFSMKLIFENVFSPGGGVGTPNEVGNLTFPYPIDQYYMS